jgi:hypothetical protein
MMMIAELLWDTNGNSHSVRSVLFVIMSFLMLIVIEKLTAVRFAS